MLKSRVGWDLPKDWAKVRKSGKSMVPLPLVSAWGSGGMTCAVPKRRMDVVGCMGSLLMISRVPERVPDCVVLKDTVTVVDSPGARVTLFGEAIKPVRLLWMLVMMRALCPLFWMVSCCCADRARSNGPKSIVVWGSVSAGGGGCRTVMGVIFTSRGSALERKVMLPTTSSDESAVKTMVIV